MAVDQNGTASQRKKRQRVRKFASIVSKRASTSFSRRTGRHEKSFRPSEDQTIAPDVENVGQIVGLNIEYIHIYIYIYIHTGSVGGQAADSQERGSLRLAPKTFNNEKGCRDDKQKKGKNKVGMCGMRTPSE